MASVTDPSPTPTEFRFYAELNDFLRREHRQRPVARETDGTASVKDMIESLGVPHTEVDLILVDGEPVGFEHRVRPGDHVSVYPMFETLDIKPIARLRPEPLRETRFVLDTHLGKLARLLRLLGFDVLYRNDFDDDELAEISSSQRRVLLTRDRGLLKRKIVDHGYCPRAADPRAQAAEVVRRFDLARSIRPFSRCLSCNGNLATVDKAEIEDLLEPKTRRYYDAFRRCDDCGKIFWKGSHVEKLQAFIEELQDEIPGIRPGSPTS